MLYPERCKKINFDQSKVLKKSTVPVFRATRYKTYDNQMVLTKF